MKELYTVLEAANVLKTNPAYLYELIHAGKIPSIRVNGVIKIHIPYNPLANIPTSLLLDEIERRMVQ